MKESIKITKCLFPSEDGNWTGIPEPNIEGMQCITTSIVKIGKRYYEQFEFIPVNIDLCFDGNAKREGDYVHVSK